MHRSGILTINLCGYLHSLLAIKTEKTNRITLNKGVSKRCGIVSCVGTRDSAEVLLNIFEKLEYRGYDSAGIAIFDDNKIEVRKAKGRLSDLRAKITEEALQKASPE